MDLAIYKTAQGVKVIDNAGNEYYFETAEYATTYETTEIYIMPSFGGVSAWHLTKIITKNGREIRFKYTSYQMQYSKAYQTITHAQDRFFFALQLFRLHQWIGQVTSPPRWF